MKENGFYLIKQDYIDLIKNLGGKYSDNKQRPIFCCIKDKYIDNLYWAIPTSLSNILTIHIFSFHNIYYDKILHDCCSIIYTKIKWRVLCIIILV